MIEHSTFDEKILYLKSRAERIKNPRYRIFEDALRYPQRKISEIIHKHSRILLIDFQTLCKCHFCLSVFAVQKRSKDHLKLNYSSYSINHLSFQFLIFFLPSLKSYIFWQLECSVVPYMVLLHFYVDVFLVGLFPFHSSRALQKIEGQLRPCQRFLVIFVKSAAVRNGL